ncbi:DinB family protein [Membranicola marinus]|uniref:DinB family protein n=1 Tax=Membranihabitans marinus TaxID=1227546 RepID=A0A953HPH0_9BACT|nr:DinB family protein [Membranihabitans marinus]MBY5958849.1 DinB family protein [Membranihabitans marinus]
MNTLTVLQNEFEEETNKVRKFLEIVPDDKLDWKPHDRSMTMEALAVHLAEIPGWPDMMIHTEELDFQTSDYKPTTVKNTTELLELFETSYKKGKSALKKANESALDDRWTMRSGEQVLLDLNKYEAIRHALNQITHHRAQLGVYLRLLDIPIPGSYGPSADDSNF